MEMENNRTGDRVENDLSEYCEKERREAMWIVLQRRRGDSLMHK